MTTKLLALLCGCLLALPLAAAGPAAGPDDERADSQLPLDEFRTGMQAMETEAVTKAVPLSAEEASRFWPVFRRFQAEEQAVMDEQVAAIRAYAGNYATLTDEQATDYVTSLLARDQRIHDLRLKYLAEFAKVVPMGTAARVIHLTRRIGFSGQVRLSKAIPLVR